MDKQVLFAPPTEQQEAVCLDSLSGDEDVSLRSLGTVSSPHFSHSPDWGNTLGEVTAGVQVSLHLRLAPSQAIHLRPYISLGIDMGGSS